MFFFFKQKTAYEMRISDWSSDVCSSDLFGRLRRIDDRDVVDADAACNADLFEALEQAIIERLVGVYFLLIDIILDAAAPQVEIIALQLLDLGLQCLLLLLRPAIIGQKRWGHAPFFARNAAVELGDLRLYGLS